MSDLRGMRIAVLGLGASGSAAARLALSKGGDVYVSDLRTEPATAARGAELRSAGAVVELGRHDLERLERADLVVVSPGIPRDAPVLRALADRGARWISEPEFAFRFFSGPLIAVTGTNGKTTTTLLVGHLLETAGLDAAVGGNVGGGLAPPASELALRAEPPDWYVLEMSSFQLADVETFRPDIGVVTNLSPDHLDRYGSVEAYYADKARMFERARADSVWVLPSADPAVEALAGAAPGRRLRFGWEEEGADAFVAEDVLFLRRPDAREAEPLLRRDEVPLLGRHHTLNALAAALVAAAAGAPTAAIREGLRTARPLPHRLEPVAERGGVLWVNDSKATNVAAARSALASLDRPVVLLVGGKDKGEPFADLIPEGARVKAVLAFGEAGPRIAREVPGAEWVRGDLRSVVARAAALAEPGDAVLLAPACSSFDMFVNYEERGRCFRELVGDVA